MWLQSKGRLGLGFGARVRGLELGAAGGRVCVGGGGALITLPFDISRPHALGSRKPRGLALAGASVRPPDDPDRKDAKRARVEQVGGQRCGSASPGRARHSRCGRANFAVFQVPLYRETMGPGIYRSWELTETLVNQKTKHQHVVIATTPAMGVTLFCDGQRQSAENSNLEYHEPQTMPAMALAKRVLGRALVAGSSEGVSPAMLAEHGWAVDWVDIDPECVMLCAKYLPYAGLPASEIAAGGNEKVTLHGVDIVKFLEQPQTEKYDISKC